MAERYAGPGSLDINPDVVQVPADPYRGYPGRQWYPSVYRLRDLFDAQILNRHELRTGCNLGLPDPGQLDVVGQQPLRHLPLGKLVSRPQRSGRPPAQLQGHMRIQVHPQPHWWAARATPADDH